MRPNHKIRKKKNLENAFGSKENEGKRSRFPENLTANADDL